MHPGTHVFPHCGPSNCRLRMHLGLIIPRKVRIRVGNDTKYVQVCFLVMLLVAL